VYFPLSQPVRRPKLTEPLRQELTAYLSEDVECLRAYTGLDFAHWRS
jgi:hypothetical protein